jgi:benzoyl-CoA reductase subunit BamC
VDEMLKIKIDHSKCTGCRACETACSLKHVQTATNPKRSRIRVLYEGGCYFPVIAGPWTEVECNSKELIVIGERTYDKCAFCRASCPAKPIFKEPETDIALKCDFCGNPPDPSCVKWCRSGALELVEVP